MTLEWAPQSLPDQGQSNDPGLLAMAKGITHDGPLGQCGSPESSHFRAFAKRKNAVKGALMADLRQFNQILPKPLPFGLPCLGQLDSLLPACRHLKINLFFTKLDISNMYWAWNPPPPP